MERSMLAMIESATRGETVRISVTLGHRDGIFVGSAEGPADDQGLPRLVGEATLKAVEKVTEGRRGFELEGVGWTEVGDVRIAVVQVKEQGWTGYLVGSAAVRGDDRFAAVAKAVLDAVNRRMTRVD